MFPADLISGSRDFTQHLTSGELSTTPEIYQTQTTICNVLAQSDKLIKLTSRFTGCF